MATRNDITGDAIQTKKTSQTYRDNYDLIFGKKNRGSTHNPIRNIQPTTGDSSTQAPDHGDASAKESPQT